MYTGRSGYIYDKLRRLKTTNNNENQNSRGIENVNQNSMENDDDVSDLMASSDLNANDDSDLMQYFKNCVVNRNQPELREELKNSVEFRRPILNNSENTIYKLFPFYFVDPTLVIRLYSNK